MSVKEIRIEDYQYDLPSERIARYPLQDRDGSKMLVFRNGQVSHTGFSDLPGLLPPDSLVIWNNTRVIPARLQLHKATGALIEIFLLEPQDLNGYTTVFSGQGACTWKTIIGNQKKWKGGKLEGWGHDESGAVYLSAEYADPEDKTLIKLSWEPENLPFARILEIFGKTPIPPYLKRDSDEQDKTRYQTVYANYDGSVAAPTAGLHFTPEVIANLKQRNIRFDSLTLHVGSGTFIPVKSKMIGEHPMHAETVYIGIRTIRDLMATKPEDLTVVGTTSLRSLESLFWIGQKMVRNPEYGAGPLSVDQWEPYEHSSITDVRESLDAVLRYLGDRELDHIQFITRLIIAPGYQFKIARRLITNFHQPSSTLLLLVSALVGPKWRNIYDYALANDFRFLSYGDSSLLEMHSSDHGQ
jgi:S-adenosylmethionine:tRNA ribosyltransferase-isomerase